MADQRVARRYAAAIFESAQKHNLVKSVETDLDSIAAIYQSDPQFRNFLLSPDVSRDAKLTISEKLFADRTTALTMQAIRVILQKRREEEILAIRDEFTKLRRDAEGVVFASVTSADTLSQQERTEVLARLRLATGKAIEAEFEVDPNLIGGIRANFGNTVLDGSLRGGLAALKEKLHHDLLKQNN